MSTLNRIVFGAVLAAHGLSTNAANLLANPDFTTDLSGWTVTTTGTGSVTFAGTSGSPTIGSIRLTSTNGGIAHAQQCIAITPKNVDLIVRRHIVTSIPPLTEADTNIIAWDGSNCAGSPLVGSIATGAVPGFPGFFNGAAQT
ncbi:hypothetical protein GCM10009105_06600 [Dokdonella soli]|uniref:Uncharacterized protein n=2 Tax=Dokdonella soli TaxID=529810 RepID=A0ABP3TIX2_9GAMM